MSYCHLTNYGINFNNGFGPLPGNKIRQKVSQANCLSGCAYQCPTFVLTANVQNATCNNGHNGQIILNEPTEGTAPYTYTWSNGATSKDILNLVAGTYTVSILDAAGCPEKHHLQLQSQLQLKFKVMSPMLLVLETLMD
jgi:hypothetical protein